MTLILPRRLARRDFLAASGAILLPAGCAAIGAATCGGFACGQLPAPAFVPCIDYPIRRGPLDPPYPTPVEAALDLDGTPIANVPRMPIGGGAAAAPRVMQMAPRRGDGPARAPAKMAVLNRWKVPVLNVAFYLPASGSLIQKVLKIASQWSEFTGIEFRHSRQPTAEIRVGFETLPNRPDSGHWSYVGIESSSLRGKSMNLAITERSLDTEPYDTAVVLHEFGHALGCIHEHQSPGSGGIRFDPDKTIAYFSRNFGWSAQMTRDNVLKRYSAGDLLRFGPFDPDSIMLYQYDASITVDNRGTKQNFVLSRTDKEFIAKLYGRTPPTEQPPDEPPVAAGPRTLTLDGEPQSGFVGPPNPIHNFVFELPATKTVTIQTNGYTPVALELFKDEIPVELKLTTPDLVNLAATLELPSGKYRLLIKHRHPEGGGEYAVRLMSG
jgi:hypothetical protein